MERRPLSDAEISEILRIRGVLQTGEAGAAIGLDPSAHVEEVDAAYRVFAREWHPERFFSRELDAFGPMIDENFALVTRFFQQIRSAGHSPLPGPVAQRPVRTPPPVAGVSGGLTCDWGLNSSAETTFLRPGAEPARKARQPHSGVRPDELDAHLKRAQRYHSAGKEDFDAGRFGKSEANLYLATRFDPENTGYRELHKQAVTRNRQARAAVIVAAADQAESYGQRDEAVARYKKAIELDPPDGIAWFRLAQLLRLQGEDIRSAVALLRKAVAKEPANPRYRLALAEVYDALGLKENARKMAMSANARPENHEGTIGFLKRLR